jgi:hypothetical protein
MYLFIFFWTAALKRARWRNGVAEDLPLGLIFSCYMCAMMLGSRLFGITLPSSDPKTAPHVLLVLTAVASGCLSCFILLTDEKFLFWAFCLFEACIGVYFPVLAVSRGEVVEDGIRGKVYSMLRMPLNIFVVVMHGLAEEGMNLLGFWRDSAVSTDFAQVTDTGTTSS